MTNIEANGEIAIPDRSGRRKPVSLDGIIQVRPSKEECWKERIEVTSVSRNGAGFTTTRPCEVGKLVLVALGMPRELRAYDEFNELYAVTGIVQYCNMFSGDDSALYNVGVGFVGKQVPESYKEDPRQNYRIAGVKDNGLWNIREFTTEFKNRRHLRYWLSLRTSISSIRGSDGEVSRDEPMTLNVSAGGAMIITSFPASVGDKVKFACKDVDFYTLAIVRARKMKDGSPVGLHLEFIDSEFPVKKLLPSVKKVDKEQALIDKVYSAAMV
jgi:hypothetical protein